MVFLVDISMDCITLSGQPFRFNKSQYLTQLESDCLSENHSSESPGSVLASTPSSPLTKLQMRFLIESGSPGQ